MNSTNVFKPMSAAEILTSEPQPIDWVWDSFFASGDLFIFAAYMKVGKSTFSYSLALAVARGLPFLDYQCRKGGVLILALEEHQRNVQLRLRKLGMTADDPIYIHTGLLPNSTVELENIRRFIKEKGIVLVLLDSLSYWWDIKNENDNAELVRVLKPVLELARETRAAIGLIHHESKFGGRTKRRGSNGDGKSIRGGSALFGIADQAILLDHRHGGRRSERVLKTVGRYAESPTDLIIELVGNTLLTDPNPYSYRVLGTPNDLSEDVAHEKIMRALSTAPEDALTIAQKAGVHEKPARKILDTLFENSKVIRTGKGVRGDPYKYSLDADSFPGSTKPLLGRETNSPITIEDLYKVPVEN